MATPGAVPATTFGRSRSSDTREHILEAAEQIMQEQGLAACTTRAIAEAARCAEGSIYRYFADKHDLFVEVVKRRFPTYLQLMKSLPDLAGTGDVARHLERFVKATLVFYRGILPMVAGALADRELLLHQRQHFHDTGTGPMKVIAYTAEFVRREQDTGNVGAHVSPEHVARMLLGACFFQAHLEFLLGDEAAFGTDDEFAAGTVRAALDGLRSTPSRKARR